MVSNLRKSSCCEAGERPCFCSERDSNALLVRECRLRHSNHPKIKERAPPRAPKLTSRRELRLRRRPGPRPRSRTSSIKMSSSIRRDLTRSARSCQRSSASHAQSSWKSARLMELSPEVSSDISPALVTSSPLVMFPAAISPSTPVNLPSLPKRRDLRRRPLLLKRRTRASESSDQHYADCRNPCSGESKFFL